MNKMSRKLKGKQVDLASTHLHRLTQQFEKVSLDTGGYDDPTGYGDTKYYAPDMCWFAKYSFAFTGISKDDAIRNLVKYFVLLRNKRFYTESYFYRSWQ